MAKYLVTGGAGFIGSHLVDELCHQGHQVVVLDALTYAGSRENIQLSLQTGRCSLIQGRVENPGLLTELFQTHAFDSVFHLAAESHVDRSIANPEQFVTTNVMGTYHLLNAALAYWEKLKGVEQSHFRFVHISTDEVFGSIVEGAFNEGSPYQPNSPYAATKASSDLLVRSWNRTYGLPTLISNCSNNYGPRQYPEKVIPVMIRQALLGKSLPIYGDGKNVRDWIWVGDHVQALIKILEGGRPGETYCVGGHTILSNLELVRTICKRLNEVRPAARAYETLIQFVEDRKGHDFRYALDDSKAQRQLSLAPRRDFQSGLNETIDWYLGRPL